MRVLHVAFVKYTSLSQGNNHCVWNCIFWYFLETGNLFHDEKLLKIILYLCIYFVLKTAELVLERLSLLVNDWLHKVAQPLIETHFKCLLISV